MRREIESGLAGLREHLVRASRASLVLLFGSGFLAVVGVAAAVWSVYAQDFSRYGFRELAGLALGLSLPTFLAGVLLAYPQRLLERFVGAAGALLVLAGLAAFAWLYPYNWNVQARTDWSPQIILVYATGLGVLSVLVFRAVLSRFLPESETEAFEDVSEDEIRADLENASRATLNWGGIASRGSPPLSVTLPANSAETLSLSRMVGTTVTLDDAPHASTTRLRAMRGSFVEWSESDSTLGETSALAALRAAKQAELEASFWFRLKTGRLFGLDRLLAPRAASAVPADEDGPVAEVPQAAAWLEDPYRGDRADLAAALELDRTLRLAPLAAKRADPYRAGASDLAAAAELDHIARSMRALHAPLPGEQKER
ncbi:MAG TPA: hypothetical protein VM889_01735 [Candidatus Thermoplasmatota archaeon]|nr:hypothetical protein [Candidatus Thermoplasmatota archaeon]